MLVIARILEPDSLAIPPHAGVFVVSNIVQNSRLILLVVTTT